MDDNAKLVREIRAKLRWSQNKLAREMGITSGAVARWENGTRQPSEMALKLLEFVFEHQMVLRAKKDAA